MNKLLLLVVGCCALTVFGADIDFLFKWVEHAPDEVRQAFLAYLEEAEKFTIDRKSQAVMDKWVAGQSAKIKVEYTTFKKNMEAMVTHIKKGEAVLQDWSLSPDEQMEKIKKLEEELPTEIRPLLDDI
ncbi:hypothetical protein QR680_011749 [Steinernema hermaphroditum]|uniref:SXP/RAL-2 family protein Ani s 5-like cation-binding domain-containing protein n=1 Tax=Steinernema hermaphroditum TaxID=289476 RepID=A0AA39HZL2_9BILA|nr:hypothetical protein QR680_011749 [Steinernema hermaphroditum]